MTTSLLSVSVSVLFFRFHIEVVLYRFLFPRLSSLSMMPSRSLCAEGLLQDKSWEGREGKSHLRSFLPCSHSTAIYEMLCSQQCPGGSPGGSVVKNPPVHAGDTGSFPCWEGPTCCGAAEPVCRDCGTLCSEGGEL